MGRDPLLVILDLDETLFYSSEKPLSSPSDFKMIDLETGRDSYYAYIRPGAKEFLEALRSDDSFSIAIWTTATEAYAESVISNLFGQDYPLDFVFSRNHCVKAYLSRNDESIYSGGEYKLIKD